MTELSTGSVRSALIAYGRLPSETAAGVEPSMDSPRVSQGSPLRTVRTDERCCALRSLAWTERMRVRLLRLSATVLYGHLSCSPENGSNCVSKPFLENVSFRRRRISGPGQNTAKFLITLP